MLKERQLELEKTYDVIMGSRKHKDNDIYKTAFDSVESEYQFLLNIKNLIERTGDKKLIDNFNNTILKHNDSDDKLTNIFNYVIPQLSIRQNSKKEEEFEKMPDIFWQGIKILSTIK